MLLTRRTIVIAAIGCAAMTAGVDAEPKRTRSTEPAKATRHARRAKSRAAAPRPVVPSAADVLVQYQRVGRALMRLDELRGHGRTAELWPRFRSIRIHDAIETSELRLATSAELAALHEIVERNQGITVSQECLANPLANGCQ